MALYIYWIFIFKNALRVGDERFSLYDNLLFYQISNVCGDFKNYNSDAMKTLTTQGRVMLTTQCALA